MNREAQERIVRRLNEKLDRPIAAYTKTDTLPYPANPGHIFIDRHSPGDGWTRYRLMEMVNEGGGESYWSSARAMTRTELTAYLQGIASTLEAVS